MKIHLEYCPRCGRDLDYAGADSCRYCKWEQMLSVVAVLETMWDWRSMTSSAGYQQAPPYFRINEQNYTGKRLYKLIGPNAKLLVTNSCKELVSGPNKHGKPDPDWLATNLMDLEPFDVLLVCGKVAQETFRKSEHAIFTNARIIEMPHPAARTYWTAARLAETAQLIQFGYGNN